MESPLLFPVRLADNTILVLDETALPFKEEYIKVTTLAQAQEVLGGMKTRSLGQVLLFFYSCVLFHREAKAEAIAASFQKIRPTFDFMMLASIVSGSVGPALALKDVVHGFVQGFDAARRHRARYLASILPAPANILTICNINGELLYLYDELQKANKAGIFYLCETRPYLQGTRLTFWELHKNKVPAKVICDNQAARVMREGLVNCVVTGADRATTKGDVINKIGTYALARLAKHFGIPFYPLTQYPRDIDVDTIAIEERPPQEAFMFLMGDLVQYEAVYPAFDVTRAEFVTKPIVMEML